MRHRVRSTTATLCGLLLALPALAAAQTSEPAMDSAQANQGAGVATATDGGLDEIVVTAERREENLQRVPVSVTALRGGSG